MPEFVPPVPADWAAREAAGTPYLLGVEAGAAQWKPTVNLDAVTDTAAHTVTAENGRAVFVA